MIIELNRSELIALRNVLQQHVTDMGQQTHATDGPAHGSPDGETHHQLERILDVVMHAIDGKVGAARGSEPGNNVADVDKTRL